MATTTKGLPYPLPADNNDTAGDIQALADRLETIFTALTTAQINALAGSDLWTGRVVYDTTIEELKVYRGATLGWTLVGGPIGSVVWLASTTDPDGYLYCNGAAYNTTTYARLFSVIGSIFGSNLPDLRNRFVAGLGTQAEFDVIGETGGTKTVTLATANMPSHSHTGAPHTHTTSGTASSSGAHGHGFSLVTGLQPDHAHPPSSRDRFVVQNLITGVGGVETKVGSSPASSATNVDLTGNAGGHQHSVTGTISNGGAHTHTVSGSTGSASFSGSTGSAGSGTAFSILNPYIVLKPYIKF